ncbi:hypothetical protein [Stygiolobus caldivivus]|uniref:Uncharacterized protein n=1 Tax=Stygiolobus caldivivus TaxID=2824673 RepID=A0A8D5U637_9CREN|nr:hypothetical protein [Stygiolobus caldivivus]BCU70196.1 hypothetical protein KN1_14930 [Stygiolobus caldivivus]
MAFTVFLVLGIVITVTSLYFFLYGELMLHKAKTKGPASPFTYRVLLVLKIMLVILFSAFLLVYFEYNLPFYSTIFSSISTINSIYLLRIKRISAPVLIGNLLLTSASFYLFYLSLY